MGRLPQNFRKVSLLTFESIVLTRCGRGMTFRPSCHNRNRHLLLLVSALAQWIIIVSHLQLCSSIQLLLGKLWEKLFSFCFFQKQIQALFCDRLVFGTLLGRYFSFSLIYMFSLIYIPCPGREATGCKLWIADPDLVFIGDARFMRQCSPSTGDKVRP